MPGVSGSWWFHTGRRGFKWKACWGFAAEQSTSAGMLLVDNLWLGESPVSVVFGCETRETGEIYNQEADGIVGLGNSEISVINQVRELPADGGVPGS